MTYLAPNGARLWLRGNGPYLEAWACKAFTPGGHDAEVDRYKVFVGEDHCVWLRHHLIQSGQAVINATTLEAMQNEVRQRRRAHLLLKVAETFVEPENAEYWRDIANDTLARAELLQRIFGWGEYEASAGRPTFAAKVSAYQEYAQDEAAGWPLPPVPITTAYPPCQPFASVGVSTYRRSLMDLAGAAVRLDQAIADGALGPLRALFEDIAGMMSALITALQQKETLP